MSKIYLNCVIDIDEETLKKAENKYELIEIIAEILFKRDLYMKVPDLIEILNTQGFKTDYETEYTNGRGGYKLISATYAKMGKKHGEYFANKLASTFRKPDNTYAFE